MVIKNIYWNHLIGDSEDSLTLVDYLISCAKKGNKRIELSDVFQEVGLDQYQEDFRESVHPLFFVDENGCEHEFDFTIDLVMDLAALLLECKYSGSILLQELSGLPYTEINQEISINAKEADLQLLDQVLQDFVEHPLTYDLSEMCSEEEIKETAAVCAALRAELFDTNA